MLGELPTGSWCYKLWRALGVRKTCRCYTLIEIITTVYYNLGFVFVIAVFGNIGYIKGVSDLGGSVTGYGSIGVHHVSTGACMDRLH